MKKQKKQTCRTIVVVAPTYRQARDYQESLFKKSLQRISSEPQALVSIAHTADGLLGYDKNVEFHLIQWRAICPESLSILHNSYGEQRHFVYA